MKTVVFLVFHHLALTVEILQTVVKIVPLRPSLQAALGVEIFGTLVKVVPLFGESLRLRAGCCGHHQRKEQDDAFHDLCNSDG